MDNKKIMWTIGTMMVTLFIVWLIAQNTKQKSECDCRALQDQVDECAGRPKTSAEVFYRSDGMLVEFQNGKPYREVGIYSEEADKIFASNFQFRDAAKRNAGIPYNPPSSPARDPRKIEYNGCTFLEFYSSAGISATVIHDPMCARSNGHPGLD